MKFATTAGFVFTNGVFIPKSTEITVRTETTGNFSTLSLADDDKELMIQIAITPEIKKMLKGVI